MRIRREIKIYKARVRHAAHFRLAAKGKNPVQDEVSVVYLKGFEPLAF